MIKPILSGVSGMTEISIRLRPTIDEVGTSWEDFRIETHANPIYRVDALSTGNFTVIFRDGSQAEVEREVRNLIQIRYGK